MADAGLPQTATLPEDTAIVGSRPASIFHTRPYLMTYRRVFGAGKEFHRIRLPGGTAYLMSRGHTARRLEWWGAGIHDVGGACYDSAEVAGALWHRIDGMARRHHAAQLAQMPADCYFVRAAAASGWEVHDAEVCPVLPLPSTYDEYVRSLGKNMREQIKRYPKRLEKEFRVEYRLAHTDAEIQEGLTNLFSLHGKRWRARGQTGVLATPRRQKFHRELCRQLAGQGWLRLWTLRCNDQPACVLLNYAYAGKYSFFIGGFEPSLMRWSVGTCLFARVFQEAIAEGATEFDFLRGAEEYKYRFGATDRHYKTITYFDHSPRGHLLKRRIGLENKMMHKLHEKFSAANKGEKA